MGIFLGDSLKRRVYDDFIAVFQYLKEAYSKDGDSFSGSVVIGRWVMFLN